MDTGDEPRGLFFFLEADEALAEEGAFAAASVAVAEEELSAAPLPLTCVAE